MRVLISCAAFAVCAAEGLRRSVLLKKRRELISELSAMLCGFAISIRCTAPTLDELCGEASGKFAELVRESRDASPDIRTAWECACGKLSALPCCEREEAEIIRELGLSLGKSDAEGQLALIELYRERLSLCEKRAADDLAKKGRLFRTLGVLCGLGAAVVVL